MSSQPRTTQTDAATKFLRYPFHAAHLYPRVPKPGKGHSLRPKRPYGARNNYHKEHDILAEHESGTSAMWKARYGCVKPEIIRYLARKIWPYMCFLRPKCSLLQTQNKLCAWLRFLHDDVSLAALADLLRLNAMSTVVGHLDDVTYSIIFWVNTTDLFSKFSDQEHASAKSILSLRGDAVPKAAWFTDGFHTHCLGKKYSTRRSFKSSRVAARSSLFVVSRVLSLIQLFSVNNDGNAHDSQVLSNAWFGSTEAFAEALPTGSITLADPAFPLTKNMAPKPKEDDKDHADILGDEEFMTDFVLGRMGVERVFSQFYVNQFPRLNRWHQKGNFCMLKFGLTQVAAISVWNIMQIKKGWSFLEGAATEAP